MIYNPSVPMSLGQSGQDRTIGTFVLGAKHRRGGWDRDTTPLLKKGVVLSQPNPNDGEVLTETVRAW